MSRRLGLALCALVVLAAVGLTGCSFGSREVSKSAEQTNARGAQLFAQRCEGCHTLDAAGTEGTTANVRMRERTDGPNLNARKEQVDQVLYAIRNGGFSGAIMPQNIVTGADAQAVAEFVARYSGSKVKRTQQPSKPQPVGIGGTP